jgi:hypothetical protein
MKTLWPRAFPCRVVVLLSAGVVSLALLATPLSAQLLGSVQELSFVHPNAARNGDQLGVSAPQYLNNTTPCDVLVAEYGSNSLPYYTNFSIIFAKICVTPQFVSLYEGMGPSGMFNVGEFSYRGTVTNLSFALYWVGNCTNASMRFDGTQCMFMAYWVGNLSNNTASGPYISQGPLVYNGGGRSIPSGSSSLSGESVSLLLILGGIGGVAAVTAVGVTIVRWNSMREAILRDQETLAPGLGLKSEGEEQSFKPRSEVVPGSATSKEGSTDTLEDVF